MIFIMHILKIKLPILRWTRTNGLGESLNNNGGYYLVVMDEKIEAVHEVSGPY